MKSRFVFKVEKKIGSLPDISYKCVFEREVSFFSCDSPSIETVIDVLSALYPDHRISVICE